MKIPEGWKLVPVEPTVEMVEAGLERLNDGWYINGDETCAEIFKGMLAAAPPAPAQEDEPVAWMYKDGYITRFRQRDATIPLYTRPADSELRKAAEEFVDYFNPSADADRSPEQIVAFLQAYEKKLRAALEAK